MSEGFTPLRQRQLAQGAVPELLHFGKPLAEHVAATTESALFDLTAHETIVFTGADRAKFLHNFCTHDIRVLTPGQGCEAFVTNVQGKLLGHVLVAVHADRLLLDSVPGSAARLVPHWTKYCITEDVEIADQSADWATLFVSGPESDDRLGRLLPVRDLAPYGTVRATLDGCDVWCQRFDGLGTTGYLLKVPATGAAAVWQRVCDQRIRPAGSLVYHGLRIAAGLPEYGVDLTDANLAQEAARTSRAISFTKGCYLGQEPIARIDALGHVNQELRVLQIAAGEVPAPGSEIYAPGQEKSIGRVTSAALDYGRDQSAVAYALVKRNYTPPGTRLLIRHGAGDLPCTVQPAE